MGWRDFIFAFSSLLEGMVNLGRCCLPWVAILVAIDESDEAFGDRDVADDADRGGFDGDDDGDDGGDGSGTGTSEVPQAPGFTNA